MTNLTSVYGQEELSNLDDLIKDLEVVSGFKFSEEYVQMSKELMELRCGEFVEQGLAKMDLSELVKLCFGDIVESFVV